MIKHDNCIECDKCGGKVFVDFTFTDNKNYETFCLSCGKRWFVGPSDELFEVVNDYVKSALLG